MRKARVEAAKKALSDSAQLNGPQVPAARAALKSYLRELNEPRQPNDAAFAQLVAAPFEEPRRRPPGR